MVEIFIGDVIKRYESRLPEESRQIIIQAEEVARKLGQPFASRNHLALPLLDTPVIEQFLRKVGLTASDAKKNVELGFVRGSEALTEEVKPSHSFISAIEFASENAGDKNPIRTMNLFLGVVLDGGLPGIGIQETPNIRWRALLLELSTLGAQDTARETKQVIAEAGRVNRVKTLRDQGLTPDGYLMAVEILIKEDIVKRGKGPVGGAMSAVEQILDRHMAQNPNKAIKWSDVAREAGISRERVRQLYPKIAATREVPPVISRQSNVPEEQFDQIVSGLLKDLDIPEIAEQLKVTQQLVKKARTRINKNNLKEKVEIIRQLRGQGLTDKGIVEKTGFTIGTVSGVLQKLYKRGEAEKPRKQYRTREESAQLREQIIELRADPRNLNEKQITEITNTGPYDARNYIRTLIKEGKITSRRSRRT